MSGDSTNHDTMSDIAKGMLDRMETAGLPVPAPANPGLEELLKLGLVKKGPLPEGGLPYPDDYSLWSLVVA